MMSRLKTFSPILRRRIIVHQKARESLFIRRKIKKTPVRTPKNSEWISEDEHIEVIEKQSSTVVIEESSEHVRMEVQKSDFTQISRVSSLCLEEEKHHERNEVESNEEQQPENQKNLDDFAIGSQISQWSDWNVELPTNVHKITINNVTYYYPQVEEASRNSNTYSIIPQNLKDLLRYKNKKMVEHHFIFSQDESQKQICFDELFSKKPRGLETRITERTGMISEFKLCRKSLENIKIINQVNLEFIAAVTVEDNKKYLLLIDQHAVDERIRYEQLLEVYRVSGTRDEYISVLLEAPIIITDLDEQTYRVLNANQELFKKYGVTYSLENTKVIVRSIPLCFKGRKYWNDDLKLITFIRKLFAEVVESVANTNGAMVLPSSIHLAIATEACRGAIKFGDPLNVDQCEYLMKTLNYTNGFSRCAHGRPSIIPLLDITSLNTGSRKQPKKLNYASLTRGAK